MTRFIARTIPYILGGFFLLAVAAFSLNRQSQHRLSKGTEFEREGKVEDAIEQYEWAVAAYIPGNRHVKKALDRLEAIASSAEEKGATETALTAWQSIVSGLTVIESFYQPYPERFAHAEERLKMLREWLLANRRSRKPAGSADRKKTPPARNVEKH